MLPAEAHPPRLLKYFSSQTLAIPSQRPRRRLQCKWQKKKNDAIGNRVVILFVLVIVVIAVVNTSSTYHRHGPKGRLRKLCRRNLTTNTPPQSDGGRAIPKRQEACVCIASALAWDTSSAPRLAWPFHSEDNNFIYPASPRQAPKDFDRTALTPSLTHKAASP